MPDNLKSGVTRAHPYEPTVNRTYREMARHYRMAVPPARPGRPTAKAKTVVRLVERRIPECLRNERFTSFGELNARIPELRDRIYAAPLQKRPESRRELFEPLDRPALQPLPARPHEFAEWRVARVHTDCHVAVEGHCCSAPVSPVRRKLDVRLGERTVNLLNNGTRVALHVRSHERQRCTTCPQHRRRAHREHLRRTPERLRNGRKFPQDHFRGCLVCFPIIKL